jgi:hypothetical protein
MPPGLANLRQVLLEREADSRKLLFFREVARTRRAFRVCGRSKAGALPGCAGPRLHLIIMKGCR